MSDFQIVYVPGMKPKPEPDLHRRELLRALEFGLDAVRPEAAERLRRHEDRFVLVSWTYAFYDSHRDIDLDLPGLESLYRTPMPSDDERRDIDSWQRRLRRFWHLIGDSLPWLSNLVARPDLRVTLSEVRHYLDDADGAGTRTRAMVKAALQDAWSRDSRVLLIAHSLGTVIAYDSLWELSREERRPERVDLFITLGSPLATRFIRRHLRGTGRRGAERFPANIRRWANFTARGDMMALHPRLEPFFGGIVTAGLTESLVDDAGLYNHFRADFGINVHKSYGYLANRAVAECIGDWLTE